MSKSWAIYNPKIDCFWRHNMDSWQQLHVANWNQWQPLSFASSPEEALHFIKFQGTNTPQFTARVWNSYLIPYKDISVGRFPLDQPTYSDADFLIGQMILREKHLARFDRNRSNHRVDEFSVIQTLIDQKRLSLGEFCLIIDPEWYFQIAIDNVGRHEAIKHRNDPTAHTFTLDEHLPGSYAQVTPYARSGHCLFFENKSDMMRFKLGSQVPMEVTNMVQTVQALIDQLSEDSGRKAFLSA